MKYRHTLNLFFALAVFLFLPLKVACAQTPAGDDSANVISTINAYMDAFNHHDPHAVAILFAEDADFTNALHISTHGRKTIEDHLGPVFASHLKNAHRTYSLQSIRFLKSDVSTVLTDYELTGVNGPSGPETHKGSLRWVLTKENGKWLINVLDESELMEKPKS